MDSKIPIKSELINNVRNLSISRRGGVRTRGGRLPPINIRELTTGNKKVVAPNIPQRRRVIKTEPGTSENIDIKYERPTSSENTRGRGRGKQQRVYLQTGGSFLAEGPAARMKRDPVQEGSFSAPRISRTSGKATSEKNIDADVVKDLMESYVAGEEYENDYEGQPPFRLPVQKDKMACKIKLEPDGKYDQNKIKKEIVHDFETGVKKEIKTEKDEDSSFAEDSIKEEIKCKKPLTDHFLNFKDNGPLILLQLPLLSDSLQAEDHEKEKETKEKGKQLKKETESKATPKFIDNFEDGFIGKLKIMKSGRMKLTLGSVEFELLDGTFSETYQEAVAIKIKDEEGDVTVLGKVENKLILSPVIDKLLAKNDKITKALNFEDN